MGIRGLTSTLTVVKMNGGQLISLVDSQSTKSESKICSKDLSSHSSIKKLKLPLMDNSVVFCQTLKVIKTGIQLNVEDQLLVDQ